MCTYIHIHTYMHHQGSRVLNQVLNLVLSIPAFLVTKPVLRRGSIICFKNMFKFSLLLNLLCLFCKKKITYHKLKLHRIITKYCVLKVDFVLLHDVFFSNRGNSFPGIYSITLSSVAHSCLQLTAPLGKDTVTVTRFFLLLLTSR